MGMSQKKTENGIFRTLGIDLGTTNSAIMTSPSAKG
jgi:molecular chaperone DnaK (HSP70)